MSAELKNDHPDPNRRWRNRRRMAWACLVAAIVFALLSGTRFVAPEIAMPFYAFCAAVVGVYVGFSSWETTKLK